MEQVKNTHHGKFINDLIDRSGKSKTEIIKMMGVSRTTLYRWFEKQKLNLEIVDNIALACAIKTEGELPELDYYRKVRKNREKGNEIDEPTEKTISLIKYIDLLEQLNSAREQVNYYQRKYYDLKERKGST